MKMSSTSIESRWLVKTVRSVTPWVYYFHNFVFPHPAAALKHTILLGALLIKFFIRFYLSVCPLFINRVCPSQGFNLDEELIKHVSLHSSVEVKVTGGQIVYNCYQCDNRYKNAVHLKVCLILIESNYYFG